ncbi:MAG: hypothetical protein ILP16_00710 [Spirochaetales bacterium]|nr:hypothetical protein [Spirochaetales bacterium]
MDNSDNRNRKKKKNSRKGNESGQQAQQSQSAQNMKKHMTFDELAVPQVNEPRPQCRICGEPIEFIAEAIGESDGGFSHFDCVISKLKEQENVREGEYISYIGHGNFAVFTKDEEGHFVIKTRIPYESKENYDGAKKYVEGTKE